MKHWYITLQCSRCGRRSTTSCWGREDEYKFVGCSECREGVIIIMYHGAFSHTQYLRVEICDYPSGI